jgi:hypothetical protein
MEGTVVEEVVHVVDLKSLLEFQKEHEKEHGLGKPA